MAANWEPVCAPIALPTSLPDRGVLITRPEPGASETAARVAAMGLTPVVAPLLQIRCLAPALPPADDIQAILVTSGNAIPALPSTYHQRPLFAVGNATASRAREAGFGTVSSADGEATALAALVARSCDHAAGSLLLATGKRQGRALTADLRGCGFSVIRRVVYAAVPVASLPEAAGTALLAQTLSAAMFFSAETARHAVHLLGGAQLAEAVRLVEALAIGATTAVALESLPWRRIRVAARPNQEAMLALLR